MHAHQRRQPALFTSEDNLLRRSIRVITYFRRLGRRFAQSVACRWRAGDPFSIVLTWTADPAPQPTNREHIMNVLKHMEAIFIAAAILAGFSSYAVAANARSVEAYQSQVSVGMEKIAVVKVSAAR